MSTYGAILPGATRLARLPAEPSAEAKRRLDVISGTRATEGECGSQRVTSASVRTR